MSIYLQNLAAIQPRTSPVKFARSPSAKGPHSQASHRRTAGGGRQRLRPPRRPPRPSPGGSVRGERANLKGLVLGCIEAKFCKKICVGKGKKRKKKESSRRDRRERCTPLHRSQCSKFCSKIAEIFAKFTPNFR